MPSPVQDDAASLAKRLWSLAYNFWYSWNPLAKDIFEALSPRAWENHNHSAIAVLRSMSERELEARLREKIFVEKVRQVLSDFEDYMAYGRTWGHFHTQALTANPVAYFSAEFGFHESVPVYSGGLGILAGDHTKSASDLGIPFVGISLLYRKGYFKQTINSQGWQEETYPTLDTTKVPLQLVTGEDGAPLKVQLPVAQSNVFIQAWRANVGRVQIYVLDTNLQENEGHYRDLTAHVYGGDHTTRIMQEMVLGIGGVRFLRALDLDPAVFHINEGHPAFLILELMREQLREGKNLEDAENSVRERCVFTTHTPVIAGHDRFSRDLLEYALGRYWREMEFGMDRLMAYGRVHPEDPNEAFCMTVLGLKMTRHANAVSELNGRVARAMWKDLFPGRSAEDVPIGHITNGIHTPSWGNKRAYEFWSRHCRDEDWLLHIMKMDFWERLTDPSIVSDEELWALRYSLRRSLVEYVRDKVRQQAIRQNAELSESLDWLFNADALTIGFARRFATYKRAPLIFTDEARVSALFNNPERPIQIIFAGKAHPRDEYGKEFIRRIVGFSRHPQFSGKVVFLENYNIELARHLVSGCDLWLNNPRRPLEACGTSGQKIALNGGLNCSILDGWWREGYDGTNGFAIGEDSHSPNQDEQDRVDCENLYRVLETQIIPEYYDRDEKGLPRKWLERIRRALVTLIPQYSTDRMVAEYVEKYYLAALSEKTQV